MSVVIGVLKEQVRRTKHGLCCTDGIALGNYQKLSMQLSSTFEYQGWKIRYALLSAETSSTPNAAQPKPVVFVHGTPWSSIVYRPLIEALLARRTYQILVYDLPGYGESQKFTSPSNNNTNTNFEGDTSVKFQAEALTQLLNHVGLDGHENRPKPAIVAHDIAGTIVLRAHLIHNCEFNSMILADANTVLPWGDGFYKMARSEPTAFLNLPPNIFSAVVRAVIQSACHNVDILKTGWEDALARPWLDDNRSTTATTGTGEKQRSFVRQIAQANDADVAEMLDRDMYADVRCDVKIIWGEEDKWIPRTKIESLIEKLNGRAREVAFIPGAGHLVMLDQPERFAIEVFDWLRSS